MSLPNVKIKRTTGNLGRVKPTTDNVFALVLSGNAVAGKIGLNEPKSINDLIGLTALGITEANNPLAFAEVTDFYAKASEGTKVWVMLYSDATLLADICDKNTGIVKNVLLEAGGEIRGIFVNKKLPAGYTVNRTDGLDQDVWNGVNNLQALCEAMGDDNNPLFGVLPGIGFSFSESTNLRDLNTMSQEQVSIIIGADDNTGKCAIGTLAGWLAALSVHQNIGWVGLGSVLETAWFMDVTPAADKTIKSQLDGLHDKRYIFFRKINQKSGFFFNDDPTATSVADDYSSISWNRVINKAHVLCYNALIDHLNEDVEADQLTGGISPTLACDWEGDVEKAINAEMKKKGQITAVKCTIDPTQSNLTTDQIKATLLIVRKGQAKTIQVDIGYTTQLT